MKLLARLFHKHTCEFVVSFLAEDKLNNTRYVVHKYVCTKCGKSLYEDMRGR